MLEAWIRRFGPNVSQLYGQTEAPMCITSLPKSLHSLDDLPRLASCGRPNIGVQVAIMRDDGSLAGDDEPGEIVTRSPAVMSGYWHQEKETAETCAYDWLHTGDLGYRDKDGFYYIVGRAKEMIISGGFNVYPKEIEDLIGNEKASDEADDESEQRPDQPAAQLDQMLHQGHLLVVGIIVGNIGHSALSVASAPLSGVSAVTSFGLRFALGFLGAAIACDSSTGA